MKVQSSIVRSGGEKPMGYFPSVSTNAATYTNCIPPRSTSYSYTATSLPWRPDTYYKTARSNPKLGTYEVGGFTRMPPIQPTNRTSLFSRYTPGDWFKSNVSTYKTSESWRKNAERLREDTKRLVQEKDQLTERTQRETDKNLGERVSSIAFWKSELQHETSNQIAETNALKAQRKKLEQFLDETEAPLHVAKECLYHREKRTGNDLVHDDVEKKLIQEVDLIKSCQDRLRRFIEKSKDQLNENRSAQHHLESDHGDKFSAWRIDNTCRSLNNASDSIHHFRGVENIDATITIPETWAKFSDNNLIKSQSERAHSSKLRDDIEKLLTSLSNEMWAQFNAVNIAFTARIAEISESKHKLQIHLTKTLQEIFETEQLVADIKRAIAHKDMPLRVAQTRLDERTRRPNVELCRDPTQLRLVQEVNMIDETIKVLSGRLNETLETLQGLVNAKSSLEHELSVKANSLFIDQEKCMSIRKSFPTTRRMVVY